MKKIKNLVVGAGFSGATIAERIATQLGEEVVLIDKKNHLAGNSYDYRDENGICIHKYGSHIFHTNSDKVWEYLNGFSAFNDYQHKVVAVLDGVETTIPFNLNSIYDIFESDFSKTLEEKLLSRFEYGAKVPILEFQNQDDEDLKKLAEYIYQKVFLNYTSKQWGVKPEDIDKSVTARVPVFISRDNRYFQDKYQGIPTQGYTKLIEKMLTHPKIRIALGTDFVDVKDGIECERIFYTGSVDEIFDYSFGVLPYRSVYFEFQEYNQEFYQSNSVLNYPNENDFTRIHEYKYYLGDKSDKTVTAKEFPESFEIGKNERYYPIQNPENLELYRKYVNETKKTPNLYLLGRLGDYKYYDMDKAVLRALELFEEIR